MSRVLGMHGIRSEITGVEDSPAPDFRGPWQEGAQSQAKMRRNMECVMGIRAPDVYRQRTCREMVSSVEWGRLECQWEVTSTP